MQLWKLNNDQHDELKDPSTWNGYKFLDVEETTNFSPIPDIHGDYFLDEGQVPPIMTHPDFQWLSELPLEDFEPQEPIGPRGV